MGKGLDDEQLEIMEVYTLKDKQQFSLKGIGQLDELYYNFIIWYNAKPSISKYKKIDTNIIEEYLKLNY